MPATNVYHYSPSSHDHSSPIIPLSLARSLDAILVLGGGVPSSPSSPPHYVMTRCDAAAQIFVSTIIPNMTHNNGNSNNNDDHESSPVILCLSAGTAHLPQLMSAHDGLPVWESTASAAYLLETRNVPKSHVYAETTSYDTISNAFFARTSFTDVAGWKNLLVVTNEFHMNRTKAIFDWIFGIDNSHYNLHYLSCDNTGLSDEAVHAREEHEARGERNVQTILSQRYTTMKDVWTFLTTDHDFFAADKLVKRAVHNDLSNAASTPSALKDSYGGTKDGQKLFENEGVFLSYRMLVQGAACLVFGAFFVFGVRRNRGKHHYQ